MAGPDSSLSTAPETSRGHASRIDRSYYTRTAPLLRGRRWLMFLAFVAALGWSAWALTDKSHQLAPGAVVAAHATWENDCQACHVPLSPIREGGWQEQVIAGSATHPAKCEKCHALASHSLRQVPAEVGYPVPERGGGCGPARSSRHRVGFRGHRRAISAWRPCRS